MSKTFFSENKLTKYPFTDMSKMYYKWNSVIRIIPMDFIIDAKINSQYESLYIGSVYSDGLILVLEVTSHDGLFATVSILKSTHESNKQYILNGADGHLIVDNISFLDGVYGEIEINPSSMVFLPRVIDNNLIFGVSSIEEPQFNTKLVDNIALLSGYNFTITNSNNKVTFDVSLGSGLGVFCGAECEEPEDCLGCVRTINQTGPDDNGNLGIFGVNFATVTDVPIDNQIIIGTQIDPQRIIECVRTGDAPLPGIIGPSGPVGLQGDTPDDTVCYYCDSCLNNDTCGIECGTCDLCESCNLCERE